MIWIELLGPSGVGKSYWYTRFIQKYPELEPENLLLKRAYEKRKHQPFSFKINCFFFFYKLNIPKFSSFFKLSLVEHFIKHYPKSKEEFQQDNIIAEKYLKTVRLYQEPEVSILAKIQYFAEKLNQFRAFQHYLNENDIYLAEDGLLHLSPIYLEELQPDFAIVLQKEKKEILLQRKKRAETTPRLVEKLFSEKELHAYLDNYFQLYESKIKALNSVQTIVIEGHKDLLLEKTHAVIQELTKA